MTRSPLPEQGFRGRYAPKSLFGNGVTAYTLVGLGRSPVSCRSNASLITPVALRTLRADGEVRFDVFLSHNSEDTSVVEGIAERLRSEGLQPWLDR